MARVTPKCRAVVACCPGVSDERLRLLGWEPAADADAAMARALELSGGAASDGSTNGGAVRGGAARAGRGHDAHDESRLVVLCPRAQRALFV